MSAPYFFAKAAVVATAYEQIWTNSEPRAKKSIGFKFLMKDIVHGV